MQKNVIKLSVAAVLISLAGGAFVRTTAYPPYVRQAAKFGAKDCTFCHTNPAGGEGWNERGKWLMAEKDKRKADSIEMEWLAEYKEGVGAAGETKAGEAGENKGAETKAEDKDAVKEGEKATEGDKAKESEKATEGDKAKEGEKVPGKDKPEEKGDAKDKAKDGDKTKDGGKTKDGDKTKEEKKDKPPRR
jgi:hypothetical protein